MFRKFVKLTNIGNISKLSVASTIRKEKRKAQIRLEKVRNPAKWSWEPFLTNSTEARLLADWPTLTPFSGTGLVCVPKWIAGVFHHAPSTIKSGSRRRSTRKTNQFHFRSDVHSCSLCLSFTSDYFLPWGDHICRIRFRLSHFPW